MAELRRRNQDALAPYGHLKTPDGRPIGSHERPARPTDEQTRLVNTWSALSKNSCWQIRPNIKGMASIWIGLPDSRTLFGGASSQKHLHRAGMDVPVARPEPLLLCMRS